MALAKQPNIANPAAGKLLRWAHFSWWIKQEMKLI
jgi:hypothetical protein